ncbi:hypothetical protein FKW77_004896 [Venturia effusa]|uniref:Protein kinase domain-containing protein n=1 Tax=Venturia effusa TaxID=50376 RepID=A0A517L974_9PEZI|nr:hypothetical protein FKW77_004896 [Venturia effusa]
MANIFAPVDRCSTDRRDSTRQNAVSLSSLHLFPTDRFDYELLHDQKLGSGRWSTVYLATSVKASNTPSVNMITPPTTPTRSRRSSSFPESRPQYFAVKIAANRPSVKVLKEEATILSRLSLLSGSERHVVPFHGFDTRKNSLVFSALPANLEDLISNELSRLDEAARSAKLVSIFTRIAKALTTSLAWLHAANVVHADLKPANILLRPDSSMAFGTPLLDVPFTPVLADFTSSFRTDVSTTSSTDSVMGGGTYDYMSPELLTRPYPPPSIASDVYALAITLLELIIGTSPYAAAQGNRFHLIEMAKTGRAIEAAMQEIRSEARLRNTTLEIRRATGLDVTELLNLGLQKSPEARIRASAWCTLF